MQKTYFFSLLAAGILITSLPSVIHAADETVSGTLLTTTGVYISAKDGDVTIPVIATRGQSEGALPFEISEKKSQKIVKGGSALGLIVSSLPIGDDLAYHIPKGKTANFTIVTLFSNDDFPRDPEESLMLYFGLPVEKYSAIYHDIHTIFVPAT